VRPGDRVGASLPNVPEIVVAFLAAMRIGAVWVGVNRVLASKEKAYELRDAGVSVLLADDDAAEQLAPPRTRGDLPDLRHVVRLGEEWDALVARGDDAPAVDIDPFAPAAIAYTSGTTGYPKGAVHGQHNLLVPGAVYVAGGLWGHERYGVALPLTVLNLIVLCPLVAFQHGTTVVCIDRVDAAGLAEWIRAERVQTFSAVPTMVYDLLTAPDVADDDLVSLVRPGVGGADCPPAIRELYEKRFGVPIVSGYGLTEAPTSVTVERAEGPFHTGAAGWPLPHVRITIRDDEGRELHAGEVGEICVEAVADGAWAGVYTPFLGYWNQPDASAEALRGDVLHTGDIGALGADGSLFVKGRRSEVIIRGGANVYPAEVERVLHDDARVAACAVVGCPDERLGERVVAYVQLAPGAPASEDDLRAHCLAELARYKVPERWVFVDDLPRNAMGKVVKTRLRPP
jgi:acyl-CoA synthetase (AMP-forming)/AMP-acid ligase II